MRCPREGSFTNGMFFLFGTVFCPVPSGRGEQARADSSEL